MAAISPWAESAWQKWFPDSLRPLLAGGGHRTHKIIIIDGSFSMAAKVGDETLFDRARAKAQEVVTKSSRGDGFSVLLMSAPARGVVPRPQSGKGLSVFSRYWRPGGKCEVIVA